jgi:hypothetical protein
MDQLGCLMRPITIKQWIDYSALRQTPEAFNGGVPSRSPKG